MTATALEERERLRAEQVHAAQLARDEHRARMKLIREELKGIPAMRREALQRQVRTGEDAKVEGFDRRAAELEADLRHEDEAAAAAGDVALAAVRALERLHFDRFGEFCEFCEGLTAEAAAQLAGLRESYLIAYQAIERARAEWVTVTRDYNAELRKRSSVDDRVSGRLRQSEVSAPPQNPLPPPGQVFGAGPIRPPEVEPVEEER